MVPKPRKGDFEAIVEAAIERRVAEIRVVAYATLFLAAVTAALVLGTVLKNTGF